MKQWAAERVEKRDGKLPARAKLPKHEANSVFFLRVSEQSCVSEFHSAKCLIMQNSVLSYSKADTLHPNGSEN